MKGHTIDEKWVWLVRRRSDGAAEMFGVKYPNGDRQLAADMGKQQWNAYLRKGGLQQDDKGNITARKAD